MHHLDANKTAGEEARRQLHKNVASNIKQVLAATPHKAPTIQPPSKTPKSSPAKTGENKGTEEGEKKQTVNSKRGKTRRKPYYKNREKKKRKKQTKQMYHMRKPKEKEGQWRFYYRGRGGEKIVQKSKHATQNNSLAKTTTTSPNYSFRTNTKNTPVHLIEFPLSQTPPSPSPISTPSYSPGPIRQREVQHHNHHHYHHRTLNNELSRPLKISNEL